jgi:hypothetical protein
MAKKKGTPAVDVAQDMKWQAEQDLRTLVEANVIKADGKRYKAAIAEGKEQKKAINDIVKKD